MKGIKKCLTQISQIAQICSCEMRGSVGASFMNPSNPWNPLNPSENLNPDHLFPILCIPDLLKIRVDLRFFPRRSAGNPKTPKRQNATTLKP